MKTKRALMVVGIIGLVAFLSAGYCFWLMTVPLSYNWVYVVVIGFILSLLVLGIASISSLVLFMRLRRSRRLANSSEITLPR
jgi:Kef-type K+ transport system membrane component KefB